jgi:hypothetical protein
MTQGYLLQIRLERFVVENGGLESNGVKVELERGSCVHTAIVTYPRQ